MASRAGSRFASRGVRLPALAAVALVGSLACAPVPQSPRYTASQSVCAENVSIARVEVTIVESPPDGTIYLEVPLQPFDGSTATSTVYPDVPAALTPGQTYTLPPGWDGQGLVDLGRCLFVRASVGVVYQIAAYPVTDPGVILSYSLGGAYPGHPQWAGPAWRGSFDGAMPPPPLRDVSDISGGEWHTCAVVHGGVKCWGGGQNYQLGAGWVLAWPQPVSATGVDDAISVAAGYPHTCALIADGTVECWGSNEYGEVGSGTPGAVWVPARVVGLTGASQLVANAYGACALLSGGTVKCWGRALANGSSSDSFVPIDVAGLSGVTQLAGGGSTCALLADSTVRCWGSNSFGQLGDGTTDDSTTPVQVVGLTGVTQLAPGCAVLTDTTIRCWGYNGNGQLGDGTTNDSGVPVTVTGLTGAVQISAGSAHTCAVVTDSTVRCWGWNRYGQLGDGTFTDSTTPVQVSGLTGVVQVDTGDMHTCARLEDGTARCWGLNNFGQLGNGPGNPSSPYPVAPIRS